LADEQVEYQIRDRLSFMRFLGLGLEDTVPDATTVWLLREALAKVGLVKTLFERFHGHLDSKGYIARGGQIVDATIVNAPKQHNTRDENEAIKAGKTPEGWDENSTKNAQKDKDARWTKKNEEKLLRLQEPRQRRPQAQDHSALRGDRRLCSRQPEA
jgi:IS5 family transposase